MSVRSAGRGDETTDKARRFANTRNWGRREQERLSSPLFVKLPASAGSFTNVKGQSQLVSRIRPVDRFHIIPVCRVEISIGVRSDGAAGPGVVVPGADDDGGVRIPVPGEFRVVGDYRALPCTGRDEVIVEQPVIVVGSIVEAAVP